MAGGAAVKSSIGAIVAGSVIVGTLLSGACIALTGSTMDKMKEQAASAIEAAPANSSSAVSDDGLATIDDGTSQDSPYQADSSAADPGYVWQMTPASESQDAARLMSEADAAAEHLRSETRIGR